MKNTTKKANKFVVNAHELPSMFKSITSAVKHIKLIQKEDKEDSINSVFWIEPYLYLPGGYKYIIRVISPNHPRYECNEYIAGLEYSKELPPKHPKGIQHEAL